MLALGALLVGLLGHPIAMLPAPVFMTLFNYTLIMRLCSIPTGQSLLILQVLLLKACRH